MSRFFQTQGIRMLAVSAAFLVFAGAALAVDVKVKLTGAEETPPVSTSASGAGTIAIAADKSVSGTVKTRGSRGRSHTFMWAAGPGAGRPSLP